MVTRWVGVHIISGSLQNIEWVYTFNEMTSSYTYTVEMKGLRIGILTNLYTYTVEMKGMWIGILTNLYT